MVFLKKAGVFLLILALGFKRLQTFRLKFIKVDFLIKGNRLFYSKFLNLLGKIFCLRKHVLQNQKSTFLYSIVNIRLKLSV